MVSEHIVALDSAKVQTTISPSSSPPTKGPKLGCVQCGRIFKYVNDLDMHVRNHNKWKLNIVKTPNPIQKQDEDFDKLMCNDAGIEVESKDFLEEAVNTIIVPETQSPQKKLSLLSESEKEKLNAYIFTINNFISVSKLVLNRFVVYL